MKKRKKTLLFALCGIVMAAAVGVCCLLLGTTEPACAVVSGGLQYLADEAYLAAAAVSGGEISFTADWFDETLGGDPVTAVTVTRLPAATEGVLKLGFSDVRAGQTIPREVPYAILVESDRPIVVQCSRLDVSQPEYALMTTIAY